MSEQVLLKAINIKKTFPQGNGRISILKGIDLEIRRKESLCIVGSSGAGKSTLLHILGTLDRPSEGHLYYGTKNLLTLHEDTLAVFRNQKMGFVFQFHHLLGEFNALENVMLPNQLAGVSDKVARHKAEELLGFFGVLDRAKHYPSQLSGGELQRVSIARALACTPEILFADEPTGNLDSQNAKLVQEMFMALKERLGVALVVVTHDISFASSFDRVLRIQDGQWTPGQKNLEISKI